MSLFKKKNKDSGKERSPEVTSVDRNMAMSTAGEQISWYVLLMM